MPVLSLSKEGLGGFFPNVCIYIRLRGQPVKVQAWKPEVRLR